MIADKDEDFKCQSYFARQKRKSRPFGLLKGRDCARGLMAGWFAGAAECDEDRSTGGVARSRDQFVVGD